MVKLHSWLRGVDLPSVACSSFCGPSDRFFEDLRLTLLQLDLLTHLEMVMRTEKPPLAGREHIMFRSYYHPVKVRMPCCRTALRKPFSLFLSSRRQGVSSGMS